MAEQTDLRREISQREQSVVVTQDPEALIPGNSTSRRMIVYFADYSQAIAHLCVFLKQKYYYIIAVITAERESPHVENLGKTLTIVLQHCAAALQ